MYVRSRDTRTVGVDHSERGKIHDGVLVQRMFVPADRVIALGNYCSYCILRHRILTELIFGGHDAQQSAATADPSSQGLAGLR